MAAQRYDIILCDYNLGQGKDGQQVLEEARFREFMSPSTIFVMITAENTMDMFMGVLEYSPDDYLIKPFTKEALGKKLRDLIRKKENLKDKGHRETGVHDRCRALRRTHRLQRQESLRAAQDEG
jgi:DNA-binding response OmpR family regulator